jgi:hypothetical protein
MDVLQFILNFTLSDLETSILPRDLAFWPACPPVAAFRIGSSFSPDSTIKPFLVHLSLHGVSFSRSSEPSGYPARATFNSG